jgi:sugar lactone lactonase YvrE
MVSMAAADDAPHFAFEWYPPAPVSPGAITIDPEGSIWYLEVPGGAIHRTLRDGNPLYSYGHAADLTCGNTKGAWALGNNSLQYRHADAIVMCDTPLNSGVHIAANADGVIFATQVDYGNPPRPNVVSVSDPCLIQNLFDPGFQPGDLTVGSDGTLFMVDLDRDRIVHWDAAGVELDSWSLPGGSALAVLATDPDGNVLIGQGHSIYKYDAMGTLLVRWGDATTFSSISGIAVNARGDVYVSDSGLNRIRMYGTRLPTDNPPLPETPPPTPPPPPPPLTEHPAAILLHVVPVATHTTCEGPSSLDSVITFQNLGPDGSEHSIVYVIATPNATSGLICGVQAGIAYDVTRDGHAGIEVQSWHLCADVEFPGDNWPASGTGNTVTWADQTYATDVNVVGYFEVIAHGASTMSVIPWPVTGVAKIANCSSMEYTLEIPPDRLGWVSWGGAGFGLDTNGCNPVREPCTTGPVPTQSVTWGRLKSLYGH